MTSREKMIQAAEESRAEEKASTPASWHISTIKSDKFENIVFNQHGQMVADCNGHFKLTAAEMRGNAVLIAHTPDLLAFAKLVAAGHLSRNGFIDAAERLLARIGGAV